MATLREREKEIKITPHGLAGSRLEVSDHYHPRWHNRSGDGQSEEHTHTHMQRLTRGMPLDVIREKMQRLKKGAY